MQSVLKDETIANDSGVHDHNWITYKLKVQFGFEIFQYMFQILLVAYVIGFTWFIIITYYLMSAGSPANKETNYFVAEAYFEWDEGSQEWIQI